MRSDSISSASWPAERLTPISRSAAEACLLPLANLATRLAEDARVDLSDEPDLLRERHEVAGIDEHPFGVRPAHQRLEAHDPVGLEVHDRLVVRDQVVRRDRRPQLGFQLDARQHQGVHLAAVDLEAVLPPLLRLVHGDVGVAQQLLAGDALLVEGDADAARRADRLGPQPDRQAQRFEDPLGQSGRRPRARDASSISTANSSPPRRAAVSDGCIMSCRVVATRRRSWSPSPWPRLSFTVLKSSRSRKRTARWESGVPPCG